MITLSSHYPFTRFMLAVAAVVGFAARADSRTFANAYLSFEMPSSWDCQLEGSEWVCNKDDGQQHSAIIIIAAKEIGPGNSLDEYYDHLAQPKMLMEGDKPLRMSQIQALRRTSIDGQSLDRQQAVRNPSTDSTPTI